MWLPTFTTIYFIPLKFNIFDNTRHLRIATVNKDERLNLLHIKGSGNEIVVGNWGRLLTNDIIR